VDASGLTGGSDLSNIRLTELEENRERRRKLFWLHCSWQESGQEEMGCGGYVENHEGTEIGDTPSFKNLCPNTHLSAKMVKKLAGSRLVDDLIFEI